MMQVSPFLAKIRTLILALFSIFLVGISVATDYIFRHEIKRKARKELQTMGLDVSVRGIIKAVRQGKLALFENYDTAGISFGSVDESTGLTPLHAAIIEEDQDAIEQVLIRHKQVKKTVDVPTDDGLTPLKRALNARNFLLANRLIDHLGAEVNCEKASGLPYLIHSMNSGDTEMRDYLLGKNVDVNEKGAQPYSPLAIAAEADDLPLMKRLVSQGAKINIAGLSGKPLLIESALEDEYEEMAFLLEKGANANVSENNEDPLTIALEKEDGFMTDLLLTHGAKVDRMGRSGRPLVFEAYEEGDHDWLIYLLDSGVSVNTKSPEGDSLLMSAVKNADYKMLDFLISKHADLGIPDQNGITPLDFAVARGDTALIRTLVENGAKIDPVSMISTAYTNRDNPTMNLLMNAGVSPETEFGDSGKRVLDVAVADGSIETVRTLLAAGAEIGDNLWAALLTGQDDLVTVILQSGADPRQLGPKGNTPIEYVLNSGRFSLVRPLLEAGGDPNPMYDEKESWVSRSLRNGDEDIALGLIRAGASLGDGFARDGHSLLGWSIAHEMDDVSLALIEAGVDVNVMEPSPAKSDFIEKFDESSTFRKALRYDRKIRPLMMTSVKRNHKVAQALVNAGAKNHFTPRYLYPISIAAWYSDVRMMQIIYGRNPDVQPRKIVIDLSSQRVTLYQNGKATYSSPCSTGKSGYRTPTGTYAITQKNKNHHSSIYGSAMPYFMRLSCRDFGLHQGSLPGYPASHGCIRLTWSGAKHLFYKCELGDMVVIQR